MGDSFSIGDGSGMYLPGQAHHRSSANNDSQPTSPKDGPQKIGISSDSLSRSEPGGGTSGDRAEDETPAEPAMYKNSRYQIKMDGETGQVFTDIVNPVTDAVVGRIPSYFKPSDEFKADDGADNVESVGRRTVTI